MLTSISTIARYVTGHRVKNNLQIISALIDMQRGDYTDFVPMSEFIRLSANVRALGIIHDVLTQDAKRGGEQQTLSAKTVLEKLLSMLLTTIGRGHELTYAIEDVQLPGSVVTSLELLTNELFYNAIKHGNGKAVIHLEARDGEARLEICDDGAGFPIGFNPMTAANTGLSLIGNVSRHDLRGHVRYENRAEGSGRVTIAFPVNPTT